MLAAEWGHGRRRGWLSNLHLGARDPSGAGFVMLGKTFKGLTDAMLTWQTERLLALEVARDDWTVHVRPELVVEIAFDGVQTSTRYPGGVTLRFARVLRHRPDKSAAEADTLDAVVAVHAGGGVASSASASRGGTRPTHHRGGRRLRWAGRPGLRERGDWCPNCPEISPGNQRTPGQFAGGRASAPPTAADPPPPADDRFAVAQRRRAPADDLRPEHATISIPSSTNGASSSAGSAGLDGQMGQRAAAGPMANGATVASLSREARPTTRSARSSSSRRTSASS